MIELHTIQNKEIIPIFILFLAAKYNSSWRYNVYLLFHMIESPTRLQHIIEEIAPIFVLSLSCAYICVILEQHKIQSIYAMEA